jgi:cytidylate kinase
MEPILIVIDGPAGVGKDTTALRLAKHFLYQHIDSGLLYRAVGIKVKETAVTPTLVAENLVVEDLQRVDLPSDECGQAAAAISSDPIVREIINKRLFWMLEKAYREIGGVVMCGRDGAREFPYAQVKIFLTATSETRAERRHKQNLARGEASDYEEGDLDIFVLLHGLHSALDVELEGRSKIDGVVRAGGAHVGELLALGRVHIHILALGGVADDLALIDLVARFYIKHSALLEVVEREGEALPFSIEIIEPTS